MSIFSRLREYSAKRVCKKILSQLLEEHGVKEVYVLMTHGDTTFTPSFLYAECFAELNDREREKKSSELADIHMRTVREYRESKEKRTYHEFGQGSDVFSVFVSYPGSCLIPIQCSIWLPGKNSEEGLSVIKDIQHLLPKLHSLLRPA